MSNKSTDDTENSEEWAVNPKLNMDEDAEEVTRKIAPTMVMPSFSPLPTVNSPNSADYNVGYNTKQAQMGGPTTTTGFGKVAPQQVQPQAVAGATNNKKFVWELNSVPVLPDNYSVEQTAVFVGDTLDSSVISSRISDVLRSRSIEASYDSVRAKVKCVTGEGVQFNVRLYRSRNDAYDGKGIIVEVQRRFGTSLTFQNDVQAILNGAQGKKMTPSAIASNTLPCVPLEEEDEDANDSGSTPTTEALATVSKMMSHPGFDSQYLGLQILSSLVDAKKLSSSSTTPRDVSEKLFQPNDEVGEKVYEYIVNDNKKKEQEKEPSPSLFFDDDSDEEDGDYDDDNSEVLRNLSLSVLSDSLRALGGSVPDSLRLGSRGSKLRSILLQDIQESEKHPNTAVLSASCMEHFLRDTDILNQADSSKLREAFEIAEQVGESKHVNLMRSGRNCLAALVR